MLPRALVYQIMQDFYHQQFDVAGVLVTTSKWAYNTNRGY